MITFTHYRRRRRPQSCDRSNASHDVSLAIVVASAIVPLVAVVVLGIASLLS
jgi:hypothetical protein